MKLGDMDGTIDEVVARRPTRALSGQPVSAGRSEFAPCKDDARSGQPVTVDRSEFVQNKTEPEQTAHYTTIDIIDPHGVTATLSNIRAMPAIAAHIHVGAAGRYYVYNVAGFRGVHGFRPVNGAPVLAFPRYPAWICLGLVIANLVWIVWQTNLGGGVPLMALAPFMLASLLYAALRRAANDATVQVMGDTRPVIIPGQPAPVT